MNRRMFLGGLAALAAYRGASAQGPRDATLYKNPQCDCCHDHATYLRRNGYQVKEVATHDLDGLRRKHSVPDPLYGCHLILVGGYVVEGHVAAPIIDRLLRERPKIRGISLPGMPQGSPGMTGTKTGPFKIYEIAQRASGEPRVYAID